MQATLAAELTPTVTLPGNTGGGDEVIEGAGSWFVLHTKSRQEKALADVLAARGIRHFLPLLRQVRYYGRHRVHVEMPMFPGYLFLRGTCEQAYEADRTQRVAKIIEVIDQKRMDWELKNVQMAINQEASLHPYPYLRCGMRVEVRSGPFRGLQGIIEKPVGTDTRLLLQVETLGRAVSLEIDASLLDPLG